MKRTRFPRLRRSVQALLLVAFSVAVVLLVLEVGVRLVAPQQLIELRPDIWQPADGVGWRHCPLADAAINTGERTVRFITDRHGHRIGLEPPPADPNIRVLALGDSFLEALQVDHADTLTARLERGISAARGEAVQVVNAGVGSWGPNQYLLEAKRELERLTYDAMLVFVYPPNDLVLERRRHLPPRPSAQRRRLRWPRSLSRREWVDAVAYPVNDLLESRSHLFMLTRGRARFLLMRAGLSRQLFPAVLRTDGDLTSVEAWRTTATILADLDALAAAREIPMLAVLLPGVYQVDTAIARRSARAVGLEPGDYDLDQPSRLLGRALADAGVRYLDLLPALRAAHAAGHGPLYGRVDTHLAPLGHEVVAETVLPRVEGLLDE